MDGNTRRVAETKVVGIEALEALTSGYAGTRVGQGEVQAL